MGPSALCKMFRAKQVLAIVPWLVAEALATACAPPDCETKIKPGTRFQVTLIEERAESTSCYLVDPAELQAYVVTASAAHEYAQGCTQVGATGPPPVSSIQLSNCTESPGGLGSYCSFDYQPGCAGAITFGYSRLDDAPVDWSHPVTAILEVQDTPLIGCKPAGLFGCYDAYLVRLAEPISE